MKALFRVKSKEDFSKVINNGEVLKNKEYIVYILKTDLKYTRIGVGVSSKVGCAVNRNREKRRLRALLDSVINYQKNSLDIVVIAKLEFKNKTYSENKNSLQNLLKEYL